MSATAATRVIAFALSSAAEIQQATEYDLMGVVIPKDPLNLGSGDLRI
ncbi:MAG: hypothetical protein H0U74_08670 [Bradymonadaceae bacterium]|nr:hypothetical protein [Lujinxingiaceae bacterium]